MLSFFSVKNWGAFKERSAISMRAGRERFANERCAKLPPMYKGMRLLPVASIYGPNASGKSTILDALSFVRHLVVTGTQVNQPVGIDPFRLAPDSKGAPSVFEIEVFTDGLLYRYELSLGRFEVERERLAVKRTRSEHLIYSRVGREIEFGSKYNSARHRLIAENTRDNDLFLHNAITQNADAFSPLYNWFNDALTVLGADARFNRHSAMLMRADYLEFVNKCLKRYQTGVESVVAVDIPFESIPAPEGFLSEMIASTPIDGDVLFQVRINSEGSLGSDIYIVHSRHGEKPTAAKVKLQHRASNDEIVQFDLKNESQGTRRLLELLPLFFEMATLPDEGSERVYLVDELDKSFHTALTADLIRTHISSCSEHTRRQLIFTTHDLVLMDEGLFRKDEMWFCEKSRNGEARVSCLASHPDVRSDTDLLKNYRSGKFCGYPAFDDENAAAR